MGSYYAERLSAERLRRCYELAPPRIRRYLEAEIRHVLDRVGREDHVLELGCGYGRVALQLAGSVGKVTGVDVAERSIELGRELARGTPNCELLLMDASKLDFPGGAFDSVLCLQNGICAFGEAADALVREALRVTARGGRVMFSTYTSAIWPDRLAWFEAQADEGLLGEIDREETGEGVIVCTDGFRAGTMDEEELASICRRLEVEGTVTEVDGSSLFLEIVKS